MLNFLPSRGELPPPPEEHEGAEPRVLAKDVQAILRSKVLPGQNEGDSVAAIAERAGVSTRTVYRVLQGTSPTLALNTADRLCLAADAHLSTCRLVWGSNPDKDLITSYF